MKKAEKKYTVFVGGTEVTNYLITLKEAKEIKNYYLSVNYTDVKIVKY